MPAGPARAAGRGIHVFWHWQCADSDPVTVTRMLAGPQAGPGFRTGTKTPTARGRHWRGPGGPACGHWHSATRSHGRSLRGALGLSSAFSLKFRARGRPPSVRPAPGGDSDSESPRVVPVRKLARGLLVGLRFLGFLIGQHLNVPPSYCGKPLPACTKLARSGSLDDVTGPGTVTNRRTRTAAETLSP